MYKIALVGGGCLCAEVKSVKKRVRQRFCVSLRKDLASQREKSGPKEESFGPQEANFELV